MSRRMIGRLALMAMLTSFNWPETGFAQDAAADTAEVESKPLQKRDPWIGQDKFTHLGLSAFLTGSQMFVYREQFEQSDARSLALAAGITGAIGLGKEVYDKVSGKGTPSLKDLVADLAGIALAVVAFKIR